MRSEDFDFDPLNEDTRRNPFPLYARARRDFPVYAHRNLPLLSVFRHADIMRIFRDPGTWSSNFSPFIQPYLLENPQLAEELPPFFATTDGEQHRRLRSLVNKAFTQKMVGTLEPGMRATVHELLDDALTLGELDLIQALTVPFPVRVIGQIIGVPEQDAPRFQQWSNELTQSQVQSVLKRPDPESIERHLKVTRDLHAYFRPLADERAAAPRADLISALAALQRESGRLSVPEMLQMLTVLLIAGNATTTAMLGNIIVELLAHPDQLARLRADYGLIPGAVDEVLRFASPVQAMPRLCTSDTELGDNYRIAAGQFVLIWIGSANRDEAVFERPDEFDVGRAFNPHIAFGFGLHACIGAYLARTEACIVLRALLERTRSFELINRQPLPLHSSFVARSYRSLPVRLVGA